MARGAFSNIKLAYQIVMVCGGFSAVLCICGVVFLICALPFFIYDYFKKRYETKMKER